MLHMRISKRSHIRNYNEKEKIVNIGYTWVATDGITYKKKMIIWQVYEIEYGCDDGSSVAQYLKTYNVIFDSRMLYAQQRQISTNLLCRSCRGCIFDLLCFIYTDCHKSQDSLATAKNAFQRQSCLRADSSYIKQKFCALK